MGEDYSAAQAKAHDVELAAATTVLQRAVQRRDAAYDSAHRAAGDRAAHYRGQRTWGLSWAAVLTELDRLQSVTGPQAGAAQRALAAVAAAEGAVAAAGAEVDRLEAIWSRCGRWQRYFSVPGGHIHASPTCRSLRPTTRIGWLPELSAEPVAAAVTAYGAVLCSHCFPQAPTDWTAGHSPAARAGSCPGSGQWVPDATFTRVSPRGTCPVCGHTVGVTARAKARRHSIPPEAARA